MPNSDAIETKTNEMINVMASQGWRITDQRKTLAKLFATAEGYLSAREVYDAMRITYTGISFDTVYRNLRLLCEMGVLEQLFLNEVIKFRARCLAHHHHHMICMSCEKTVSFEFCPMKHMPDVIGRFQLVSHRFDLFGYCEDCAKNHSKGIDTLNS